ncbi:MAG: hypothetical protein A2W95_06425 [Bacteroidetes bacterium GWA2_40_14]|nr:MAG: hypothetical protein A2W95_06425 [Bacteroidetes bacterium GWA2_40_14]OFZ30953.1 MAG: hypothetical protein A2437_11155 [Bacteroidetes bacterium RIFOXYC2_FULL_40_12]HAZ03526.1 hypothetical protein [Marinilabiliales bacterium]
MDVLLQKVKWPPSKNDGTLFWEKFFAETFSFNLIWNEYTSIILNYQINSFIDLFVQANSTFFLTKNEKAAFNAAFSS